MHKRIIVSVFSVFLSAFLVHAATDSSAAKDTAMKTITVDKFIFSYKIEGADIKATVSYPIAGWVAVGFNPKMVMKNAHFIMGAVINGKQVVSEEFGTGMFSHQPVASVFGKTELISSDCSIENGVTTLSFSIPLESANGKISKIAVGKETKVIFAAGASDDIQKKHKYTAKKTITF
jgi:hypothetical protein